MDAPTRPTDAELEILRIIWSRGPSTVREVFEEMAKGRNAGYTTVLKFMQIMLEKGLLKRTEAHRVHVYEAAAPAEQTQRQLVRDLADRAFGGSPSSLMMQALAAKPASKAELAAIRKMLDEYETGRKK
jgi:BlaI family transcriptional regulator, penicillinase repressor